jgi:predicted permease
MEALLQDVRHALRSLRKRPLFAATAIGTLALGIGANTAIFTLVDAALLRPLPFPEPASLVRVALVPPDLTPRDAGTVWSYPKYEMLRDEQRVFSAIAGYAPWDGNLSGAGEAERLQGEIVTARYLEVLGVPLLAGRGFTEAEARDPGQGGVAILTEALWRGRFGADPAVVGRTIRLDGHPVTVVGVAGAGFRGLGATADLFLPVSAIGGDMLAGRWAHFLTVIARLRDDVSLDAARAELTVLGARIHALHRMPRDDQPWTAGAEPLESLRVDPAIRRSVLVLFGAVTGVLLIACANIASLLLGRSSDRGRELAVRRAIGASPGRVARQFATEALVLAVIGGLAGTLLAVAGVSLLAGVAGSALTMLGRPVAGLDALVLGAVSIDARVLGFALLASLLAGVLFGAAPAVRAAGTDPAAGLRQLGGAGVTARGELRAFAARNLLVVAQVALAFVLLVGSGLMLRSLGRLLAIDAGMDARGVLTSRIALPPSTAPEEAGAFWEELARDAMSLPGARSAAITDCPPLLGVCNVRPLWIGEGPIDPAGPPPQPIAVHYITPGYLEALGVSLVRGRAFDARDRAGSPNVVLINETAARTYFPGEDPIGRSIRVGGGFADGAEIVGVIADQRFRGLESPPEPDLYIAYAQVPQTSGYVFVRTAGDPLALVSALRGVVERLNANVPVYDVQTMEARAGAATARTRLTGVLLSLFAAVALVLAMVGIYGVVAFAVARRTREIGVRVALGASPAGIAALVLRHSAALVAAGLLIGIAGALAATRVLRSLLYDVAPADPATFALLGGVTLVVAFVAGALPVLRALRVDPIVSLRSD